MGENQLSLQLFMVIGEYLLLPLDVWHLHYLPYTAGGMDLRTFGKVFQTVGPKVKGWMGLEGDSVR